MVVRLRGQELLLPFQLPSLSRNTLSNPKFFHPIRSTFTLRQFPRLSVSSAEQPAVLQEEEEELPEYEVFDFDAAAAEVEVKRLPPRPEVEVKELSELPELWRRSRVAWLCKELPVHKAGTLIRILNAQKKWMRQGDTTYVVMHCLRIRENETAFRVSVV